MPLWGRRKREALEAFSSAKALITKVKKKGMDTSEAVRLYSQAKQAFDERRYSDALEGVGEARKSARKAYARGIKERLRLNISRLDKSIKDMRAKNLDTKEIERLLKRAKDSLEGGIKDHKRGLEYIKEGTKLAEDKLRKFDRVSGLLSSTAFMLRRIEDFSPDVEVLKVFKRRLSKLGDIKSRGKVENALKEAEKLDIEARNIKKRYLKAFESIKSLEKVVRDSDVLGANLDAASQIQEANALLRKGEFESACEIADNTREKISSILRDYKDVKYHVDKAEEAVLEAKKWGFSAFEAEKTLNLAKEALKNHEFEGAVELSKESREKASTIRERHKCSSELIRSAKDEIERIKAKGIDISNLENALKDAEDAFYKGDYSAAKEKIDRFFESVRDMD